MIHIQFFAPIIIIMPRRYYRRRSANRDKYSIEQTNIVTSASESWPPVAAPDATIQASKQFAIPIIPPVDAQGMRKVKHLTVSIANIAEGADSQPVFYAIVFVPQGYEPQPISYPAAGYAVNNYPANQFVMSSGVLDFTGGPCRIRSPLSRNLNSGDRIYLILAVNSSAPSNDYTAQVQYAITNQ